MQADRDCTAKETDMDCKTVDYDFVIFKSKLKPVVLIIIYELLLRL